MKRFGYVVLAVISISILGTGIRIACMPTALVDKTLDPDNIIHNYEWFQDASRAVNARVSQISAHRKLIADEKDAAEVRRLKVELAGMQQSCRDLVAEYNANTSKINRDLFRGKTAPANIDTSVCE